MVTDVVAHVLGLRGERERHGVRINIVLRKICAEPSLFFIEANSSGKHT